MNKRIIIILTFFMPMLLWGQPDREIAPALQMIARVEGGEVMLRWAPNTFNTWLQANEAGYVVERYTIMRDGQLVDAGERTSPRVLTPEPLKPWATEAEWKPLMEQNDFAAIAAQALYGDSFETTSPSNEVDPEMMINAASEQDNRFGFALFSADHSFEVAEAMGLGMKDPTAVPQEQYLYRVYPADATSFSIDTGFTYVDAAQQYELPKPIQLQADFGDRNATISWNKELFNQFYVSYQIERSLDGNSWEAIHDAPYVSAERIPGREQFAYIVDTLTQNNIPYFYRVRGRTPFDSYGPFSDVVQGMGVDPLPTFYPEVTSALETEEGYFNVQWEYPMGDPNELQGFRLMRAKADEGPYEDISGLIPNTQFSFVDESPNLTNYYKVVGFDKYSREMESYSVLAQLNDTMPPPIATNVRGKIMDDGTMVITWDQEKPEDFYGNRVFMANNPNAEYTQITTDATPKGYHIDSVTLNTLTEFVYVKVTSQDIRYNISDFSEVVAITRPDTVAPSKPLFTAFEANSEALYFEWANSSSPDLASTVLRRKILGETVWDTLAKFPFPEEAYVSSFRDTTCVQGPIYLYMLTAIDDVGLKTNSDSLQLEMLEKLVLDSIETVRIEADRRAKSVRLSWDYESSEGLEYFTIYRCLEEGSPITYKTISKADASLRVRRKGGTATYQFVDVEVKMNTTYRYQVRAVFLNGAQTRRSAEASINY